MTDRLAGSVTVMRAGHHVLLVLFNFAGWRAPPIR